MIIDEFREEWIRKTCNDMDELVLVLSPHEDGCKNDFIKIAEALLKTKENPYSFMPKGWEGYKYNATNALSFFVILSHAMIDDGEVSLIRNKKSDSFKLSFCYSESYLSNDEIQYYHLDNDNMNDFIYWLSDEGIDKRRKERIRIYESNQKWIEENCEL